MKPLVIYHNQCADGFCAAWLMKRAFPDADFHPANYGEPPPDVTGRDVYIVDFSYKRDVMVGLIQSALKITVLDHHKTAQSELAGLVGAPGQTITFDMTKSGGRLTWEYLLCNGETRPKMTTPCPWLVPYTEDRDLWKWQLPDSRAINSALRSYPMDFATWDELAARRPESFVDAGNAILRSEQQMIDTAVKNAWEIELDGHRVLCVNVTNYISEIGGELAKNRPFGVTFFVMKNQRIWSLRSRDGGIDVSEIAKRHGGGGHRNAAGYRETL